MKKSYKIISKDKHLISPGTRRPYFPLVVKRGRGSTVEDVDGKRYIDFLSSAAVTNTGYCHPVVVKAIKEQVEELIMTNPGYTYDELSPKLAQELNRITPGNFPKKVSFGLSGSDSNDGVIQLARCYTGRSKIISFLKSFHGVTYGAMSLSALTSKTRIKAGPLVPEIYHVPFPDCYRCLFKLRKSSCDLYCLKYLRLLFETVVPPEETAAIIFEPIQGDGGIVVPPDNFYQGLKGICSEYGILLVAEEVQTGFGRTGKWFAMEHWGIEPDIIVLGKAIASGMALSAIVARARIMDAWGKEAFAHVLTFGGCLLSYAASLATIEVIEKEKLIDKSQDSGNYMLTKLNKWKKKYEMVGDVRGKGLMLGVDLVKDRKTREPAREKAAKVCWRSWEKGVILTFVGSSVLRLQPPLIITKEEIDKALDIIEQSINEVEEGKVPDKVLDKIKGWGTI